MNENTRNFSIIAHIDHGKTTLTDRLLLKSGTITDREFRERMMDSNPIEQERGITIKLAPVKMKFDPYEFNLIDTPGHVDFSYEVARSLQAVEGALLLIDVTQGVQAQTLSHFYVAKNLGLTIIPVLNKIDLDNAMTEEVQLEIMEMFGFTEADFVLVSAKTGQGVDDLIEAIKTRIPAPTGDPEKPLKALIFNSFYDAHMGVVAAIRLIDGRLQTGQAVKLMVSNTKFIPQEIGVFSPKITPIGQLEAGSVGYIATGLKDIREARVGDTLTDMEAGALEPLPGYRAPQLMVYMDFYPVDGGKYQELKDALEKLALNDAALQFVATHSPALGNGFRVGFLGILHAEIVQERLEREFDLGLIATSPSVQYTLLLSNGETKTITSPTELPDPTTIKEIREPIAKVTIYTPKEFVGAVMQLSEDYRGELKNMEYFGNRAKLTYLIPLAEIIVTFFDDLKSSTSGYASIEYQVITEKAVKAVKLNILINHEPVEALSRIVVETKAEAIGREMAKKLKEVIPRQLFEIPIQVAIGGRIIARESIKAFRKDVTAKLYGGDRTRRMKLLEKQKKGKARRKQFGKVEIPQEAFMAVLKRG